MRLLGPKLDRCILCMCYHQRRFIASGMFLSRVTGWLAVLMGWSHRCSCLWATAILSVGMNSNRENASAPGMVCRWMKLALIQREESEEIQGFSTSDGDMWCSFEGYHARSFLWFRGTRKRSCQNWRPPTTSPIRTRFSPWWGVIPSQCSMKFSAQSRALFPRWFPFKRAREFWTTFTGRSDMETETTTCLNDIMQRDPRPHRKSKAAAFCFQKYSTYRRQSTSVPRTLCSLENEKEP